MKFLCYYASENDEGRSRCFAALTKIDYICKSIVANYQMVEIISGCIASSKGHYKGKTEQLADGVTLKTFSCYKRGNILQKLWVAIYGFFAIFFYLLFHARKNEKILVYHSTGYIRAIKWAKFFKGFKLILEVEEIYGDVSGSKKTVKKEFAFFKTAIQTELI